ncbi:MAG: family 20 glycosylhydrolase, partial [Planctomycetes bacterium]|nr:family 20 glycosylhydrolase [Planctomycetota bacterium]
MNDSFALYPPPAETRDLGSRVQAPPPGERTVQIPPDCKLDLLWALGDGWRATDGEGAWLRFEMDMGLNRPQAYRITVKADGIVIGARTAFGWFHGAVTLAQWLALQVDATDLPSIEIVDQPLTERRGYMLDVSRDRVPKQGELLALIDRLARLKYNHLELYLEHTFAYEGHEAAHQHSSPITPAEMRELVAYGAARGIDLVPNQNTFGHMHRWLSLPEYNHLAEEPEGTLHAFDYRREPFGLCAANSGSLRLIE